MMMNHGKIFGTTSMGERGQLVIPSEAREELGIKSGD
ncbi:looped-hinge helix DNA binding domain-containing protein, AbrB family [Bacillus sp. OV166]|nr:MULTISPECIES: AbrB/MazE/SpoVT family DNA-binding domain-containing protein [unclassified Bacillus (in: firmicutes)]SMQ83755.1 looped-hinge helix DNA binding domain-containing protein, AbrB family [Bacillus sp. OV166]